jgi:sirohydrochlorin ferrochelatase
MQGRAAVVLKGGSVMQAILYIGHGSRVKEAVDQAVNFIEQSIESVSAPIQEICFLELAKPTIQEGIKRCVQRGATRIAIVPVLLLNAMHAKKDIPIEIDKARRHFPEIRFDYGRPFGVHPKIIDSLIDRIYNRKITINKDAMVLLVGRGSSDPYVKRDLEQIANLLHQKHPFQRVETCYLAAAEPSFEQALDRAQELGHKQVFILPYLLFTGILMKSMERKVRDLTPPNQQFVLCRYLGYHPNLQDVLLERVSGTISCE